MVPRMLMMELEGDQSNSVMIRRNSIEFELVSIHKSAVYACMYDTVACHRRCGIEHLCGSRHATARALTRTHAVVTHTQTCVHFSGILRRKLNKRMLGVDNDGDKYSGGPLPVRQPASRRTSPSKVFNCHPSAHSFSVKYPNPTQEADTLVTLSTRSALKSYSSSSLALMAVTVPLTGSTAVTILMVGVLPLIDVVSNPLAHTRHLRRCRGSIRAESHLRKPHGRCGREYQLSWNSSRWADINADNRRKLSHNAGGDE
ncbi:hypothetical protein EVAR_36618_1 [Eumeta japonica]|uniref:Uncharacterized protein n=1 Tax=Eumeta variegata TaxID=151549 RepID=A0A4C1ZP49_EUMVA|nr:hypothetical protein EVAR_36618_1 [Eumeta japonica]